MAYVNKKLRPKLQAKTFIIIGVIIAVIAVAFILLSPSKKRTFYNTFANPELSKEDHPFEEIKFKKLVKKLENDEAVLVFFGSPVDNASRTEIIDYDKEYNKQGVNVYFNQIYFINIDKLDEDEIEMLLKTYKVNVETLPQLVYFKDNAKELAKINFEGDTNLKKVKEFYLAVIKDVKAQ